jgi:hypothetical protein
MYSVILHKPESADYCRCCLMESYSGSFEHQSNLNEEQAVSLIARALSTELKRNEAGYTAIIFVSFKGQLCSIEVSKHGAGIGLEYENLGDLDEPESPFKALLDKLSSACTAEHAAKQATQAKAAALKAEQARIAKEAQDRLREENEKKELARLLAKYS